MRSTTSSLDAGAPRSLASAAEEANADDAAAPPVGLIDAATGAGSPAVAGLARAEANPDATAAVAGLAGLIATVDVALGLLTSTAASGAAFPAPHASSTLAFLAS